MSKEIKNKEKMGNKNRSKRNCRNDKYDRKQNSNNTVADIDNAKSGQSRNYDAITSNDISWWNKATELYEGATKIPFAQVVGDKFKGNVASQATKLDTGAALRSVDIRKRKDIMPGIMSIKFAPTIGFSDSPDSPVNRAFTSLYADIYRNTTGAMQFTQAELAKVVIAESSLAALIAAVKRAIHFSKTWVALNWSYPRALLASMGIDPDSVIGRENDVAFELNTYIRSFNRLRMPNILDTFARHYSLANNVYVDEDSVYGQLYTFVPAGYYVYADTANKCSWMNINDSMDNDIPCEPIYTWMNAINNCLTALRHSSNIGLIIGALERAYGMDSSNFVTIDLVDPNSVGVPVFDRNIMWQIQNAYSPVTNMYSSNASNPVMPEMGIINMDITEDVVGDTLLSRPVVGVPVDITDSDTDYNYWWAHVPYTPDRVMLNSFDNDVSPEFIMESTRLINIATPEFNKGLIKIGDTTYDTSYMLTIMGTEIVLGYKVFWHDPNPANSDKEWDSTPLITNFIDCDRWPHDYGEILAKFQAFKYRPTLYVGSCGLTSNDKCLLDSHFPAQEWYRYSDISKDQLKKLDYAALTSAYAVRGVDKSGSNPVKA